MALDALPNDEMPFDTVQEELFLAQQVYEEAKHTDLFSRYFEEVFGTQETAPYREGGYQEQGYSTDDLYDTADDLLAAVNGGDRTELVYALGEAYLNYMGIVEAQLARGGYLSFDQMIELKAEEMGRDVVLESFQTAIGKVRQDETRHIENGRWVMKQLAEAEPDIVADVYEPRIEEYVENRLLRVPSTTNSRSRATTSARSANRSSSTCRTRSTTSVPIDSSSTATFEPSSRNGRPPTELEPTAVRTRPRAPRAARPRRLGC